MNVSGEMLLYSKADTLRKKLYRLVEQLGFNHPQVISCSQDLDEIIIQLQVKKSKKNRTL